MEMIATLVHKLVDGTSPKELLQMVKAEGNVEVLGSVAGGAVEGKSVIVKGGIQGRSHGYVKAQENVIAKFIENAKVYAGADVMVNDTILHSEVSGGVEGKRGMITGGNGTGL